LSIPPECQSIENQITLVSGQLERVQQELEAADPSARPRLLQQFRALNARLHGLQNSLADCIANSTGQSSLEALFSGTATIDIPSRNEHSSDDLQFRILLNGARTVITLVSFPTITSIVHTPLGDDTVTVTRTSGGTGAYASGHIVLPLALHFAHSNIFFSDSDLSITLTTDPPGSPVTPDPFGAVTVVGSGIFQGGFLGGSSCNVTVTGTISELQLVTVPDVRESTRSQADNEIRAVGLIPVFSGDDTANALVFRQSPLGGTTVVRGASVTLTMKTGPFQ